jgi:hypothetical protein
MTQVFVLLHSVRFFLYVAPPTTFFLAATATHDNYLKHCTQWSRAIKMAASSNSARKDLLTDEDISTVLDIEGESDVFSEESDDFWFDTSEQDSDTSSVVHESEPMKKCQIFRKLLYLPAWRVQDLHFSV